MSDTASRLRLVGGTDAEPQVEPALKPKRPRKPRPPLKDQLMPFRCTPCSEAVGAEQTKLIQVMLAPMEANGKLRAGGLYWACARCQLPYYLIRHYGTKT